MERAVGHFAPEVQVLLEVLVCSRRVADDAEADERNFIEITYLGDGSRFHVYGQPFGKVFLYLVQFAAVGDKLVARADQPSVYRSFGIKRERALV